MARKSPTGATKTKINAKTTSVASLSSLVDHLLIIVEENHTYIVSSTLVGRVDVTPPKA